MTAAEFQLIPSPITPDPVAEAIAKLKEDAGALFEPDVLALLREVRGSDPARWARYRQAIKAAGAVSMADLDRLTSTSNADVGSRDELFAPVTI